MLAILILIGPPADGAPLTPGNVLVTGDQRLFEYSPEGVLAQAVPIPLGGPNPLGAEHVRDILVDRTGVVRCYNGTFTPFLSSWDPVTNVWTHHTYPLWSQANFAGTGGIAVADGYVYVTDSGTLGAEAAGIVRFDTNAEFAGDRFEATIGFLDLCIADGLLYALVSNGLLVRVYEPVSMVLIRVIALSPPCIGIAVEPDGKLLGASNDGYLYRYSATGVLEQSLRIGYSVADIDLREDGRIVMGMQTSGAFTLTDRAMSPPRFVDVGYYETFVTWVPLAHPTTTRSSTWGRLKSLYR